MEWDLGVMQFTLLRFFLASLKCFLGWCAGYSEMEFTVLFVAFTEFWVARLVWLDVIVAVQRTLCGRESCWVNP